jgi:Subtilase family
MRRLARRYQFALTTRPVTFELLERRLMLSTNPSPVPPLPGQPTPLQGVVGTPNSLDPQLLNDAYDFNGLSFDLGGVISKADGAGETIAIVDAFGNPNIVQDVETFDAETYVSPGESVSTVSGGLSNYDAEGNFFLSVQQLGATSGTYPAQYYEDLYGFAPKTYGISGLQYDKDLWATETALDVEWVHAVAPGAHILLVEAASESLTDLIKADVYASEQPGVVDVSNSWGYPVSLIEDPESAGFSPYTNDNEDQWYTLPYVPSNEPATLDGYFVTPTGHTDSDGLTGGVTFLAASGDTSNVDNFPAASREILSVGGFETTVDLDGDIDNEGAWADNGGGTSTTVPAYNNPIIGADADPSTGVWIYDNYSHILTPSQDVVDGGWQVVGGTSLACPIWAGVIGIIDQGLNLRGYGSMTTSQALGETPYDNRGTTTPGDTGPFLQIVTPPSGSPIVTVLDGPETGYGILGLAENDIATWEDFVGAIGDPGYTTDTSFPLWGHTTNSVTISNTTVDTTTTPTGGTPVPDITLTPSASDGNTGWGYPDEENGASPRGGFIQDMVGGPISANLYPDAATDGNLIGNPVTIYSDTLDSLYFTQQPSNTQIGQPIDSNGLPELVVTAFSPTTDAVDQSFNGAVTIQILEAGTLIGTTTVNAVDGSAVFANLSIDQEGTYEFLATSTSVNPAYSNAFNITAGVGTHLVFAAQPTSFWQYSAMQNAIVLNAEDQFNDFSYITNGPNVVATILTGPTGGVLTGQTTATMVNGVAKFSGIGATLPGTYVLEIRFGGMPAVTTVPFAEVPIQVTEGRSINGSPLSQEAILFQELRNSQLYASQGPPDTALSQSVINADNNLLTLELVQPALTRSMAAATYGSKESVSPVFNSSASSESVEVELLDIVEAENKLLF